VDPAIVKPDNYHHPPLIIDIYLSFATCTQNYKYSYRTFVSGDYTLHYNVLSTFKCSCVYGTTSVDAAVASVNAVVQDAMEQAICHGIISSQAKFPHWYSSSSRFYIRKKNYIYRHFKNKKSVFATNFPFIVSLLKLLLSLSDLHDLSLLMKIFKL
jgi:hypothetical protein